jgi:hypothetical protein
MALGMALATALNQELRALQAAGCSFVQVDEPDLLAHPEAFPIFTRIWRCSGAASAPPSRFTSKGAASPRSPPDSAG